MTKDESQKVLTDWIVAMTEFTASVELAFNNQSTNNTNFEQAINKIISNTKVIHRILRKFNKEMKGLRELAIDYEMRLQELERVIKYSGTYNPNANKHYREV